MPTAAKPKVIFFGNERLSSSPEPSKLPLLNGLLMAEYEICAIVVSNRPSTSRKSRPLEVAEFADKNGIEIIYVEKLSELKDRLASYNAQAGVLAAFGKIVPQSIIDIFPLGIINVHPSDLPQHRGSTPIEATMLSGQTHTAVSIMQLDAGMDTGPVFAKQQIDLTGQESKAELTDTLAAAGAQKLVEILPEILSGQLQPTPQNHDQVTHTPRLSKQDGQIDWTKPAEQLEREIRAYYGWPGSYGQINDVPVIICQAQIIKANGQPGDYFIYEKKPAVYCGQNALLIERLKPQGKGEMDAVGFVNGYLTTQK